MTAQILSIKQPYASFIVLGLKEIETRTWKTDYRGLLYIHASAAIDYQAIQLCYMEPFRSTLKPFYRTANELPLGAIIGHTELTQCSPTEKILKKLNTTELLCGNFAPGRFAWILKCPQRIVPIPCKGKLGIWTAQIAATTLAE
jgi:hypothetical protein